MKPWKRDPTWFRQYSHAVLKLKDRVGLERTDELTEALRKTFTCIYRAIAFDIDGTLTLPGSSEIDERMASIVGRLLQRGVPTILITGRGRQESREAAKEIRRISGLSNWYMRRLQCITGNGTYLLQTPIGSPESLLSIESPLVYKPENLQKIAEVLRKELDNYRDTAIKEGEYSIRTIFRTAQERDDFERVVRGQLRREKLGGVFIARGEHADMFCLDLTAGNKNLALAEIAKRLGIPQDKVLRLGDQGHYGGNDYNLLASTAGFSVDKLNPDPFKCHPILADDMSTQLKGVAATKKLLNEILLFPPLSIRENADIYTELRDFEQIALTRSRQEKETVTQRVRVRLRYLLEDPQPAAELHYLDLNDIFDDHSGGVRFREWELERFERGHRVHTPFDLPSSKFDKRHELKSQWCMYTDTGVLMRGPHYYFGETELRDEYIFERFLKNSNYFISNAIKTIEELSGIEADLLHFKLVLAIQDNVRNILLQFLYITFLIEGSEQETRWELTKRLFTKVVAAHSDAQYKFLLNPDADWATALPTYNEILRETSFLLPALDHALRAPCSEISRIKKLFKWRECDNFLQNVAAVQLGLHELRQQPEIREANRLLTIGLAYGGIELPGIALAVANARGFKASAGLLGLSIYSDAGLGNRVRAQVRAGKQDYIDEFLSERRPFCLIDGNEIDEAKTVVMDDNCTTCLTLQVSRDVLVTLGADVVGALVVRFPGMNRHVQMARSGHGFPDPKVLFNFIRGLVAPSPYTRLVYQNHGKRSSYLDQTKVFDKGRTRIQTHLKKNGTPSIRER